MALGRGHQRLQNRSVSPDDDDVSVISRDLLGQEGHDSLLRLGRALALRQTSRRRAWFQARTGAGSSNSTSPDSRFVHRPASISGSRASGKIGSRVAAAIATAVCMERVRSLLTRPAALPSLRAVGDTRRLAPAELAERRVL